MLPLKQFQDFIDQQELFVKDNRILLAVSGGRDSVLMLHLFKSIGANIAVAHCNFNLRGDESQRDEAFVKLLAQNLDLPVHITHFDTKKYAAEHKISTQMAARTLRYTWFDELRQKEGFDFVALAQHQNDAVETVLINLLRGTGISGLHGILPKREHLIRPLLFLNREEIEAIVNDHHLDFVEDSSNLSTQYTRNKLRLHVMPHLKEINPDVEKTFAENISRFSELETFLKVQVAELSRNIVIKKGAQHNISIREIRKLKPKKLLLYELLKPFHFSESVIAEIVAALDGLSGKQFFSNSHQAILDREDLILVERKDQMQPNQMIHSGADRVFFGSYEIHLSTAEEIDFGTDRTKIFVDSNLLIFPLVLRNWQNGDKFKPFGMNQLKKISDFFIDEKVPLNRKHDTPILINGNGEVIWIAGMRQDNRYKLTRATKKVTIFELKIN